MTIRDSIGTGFRRATRWRLLLLGAILSALPAAIATIPVQEFLSKLLGHAPRADLLARGLELSWLPDLARALADSEGAGVSGGIVAAFLVALTLAPALTGAVLAQAGSDRPLRIGALLEGAGHWYGRMLRMAVVAAIPLGLAGAAAAGLSKGAEEAASRMVTEAAAASRTRLAFLAAGALLVLAHLTLDAGRARMAARPTRRSAFLAWLAGAWMVVRHPLQSGVVALASLLAGPLLGLVFMGLRERLPAGPTWAVVAGVGLAQLAAAAVMWGRAVRVAALARVARGVDDARLSRRRAAPPP